MRIVHVVYSLGMGGQERIISDLAFSQRKQGHEVAIFSLTRKDGPFHEMLEGYGIRIFEFHKRDGFSPSLLFKICSQLRNLSADVVHTHNHMPNLYGAIAGFLSRTPTVINTRHGYGGVKTNRRQEAIFRFSSLFTYRVVAVSKALVDHYIGIRAVSAEKVVCIPNGIDVKKYSSASPSDRSDFRKELGISSNTPLCGIVSRLSSEKNLFLFIDAVRRVTNKMPTAMFVIAGDGPERNALSAHISGNSLDDNVLLLGQRNDIPRLLSALDLFVLCSKTEGMPLTLIEAMAAGRPVIATDVGGVREVVEDGRTGIVIPSGDEVVLSEKMLELLLDRRKSKSLGSAAKERAFSHFHLSSMVDSYFKLYRGRKAL